MLYKYTWTPSIKRTHSLITDFDSLRALTDLSFGDSSASNPPGFKPTCIDWEEAN